DLSRFVQQRLAQRHDGPHLRRGIDLREHHFLACQRARSLFAALHHRDAFRNASGLVTRFLEALLHVGKLFPNRFVGFFFIHSHVEQQTGLWSIERNTLQLRHQLLSLLEDVGTLREFFLVSRHSLREQRV